jgi:hypothetical protein
VNYAGTQKSDALHQQPRQHLVNRPKGTDKNFTMAHGLSAAKLAETQDAEVAPMTYWRQEFNICNVILCI